MPQCFFRILKVHFALAVEKFGKVRALKIRVANAIIHSKSGGFFGCELDYEGAVLHPDFLL